MSSSTNNLGLYKVDPSTDGENTFNIKTMLNDNWDKIDNAVLGKANIPVSSSKDLLINSLNSQTIAAYTPSTSGNFEIKAYLRILSVVNITVLVNYTDNTGAKTKALLPDNIGLSFPTSTGIQAYKTGSYALKPLFINATAGTAITITATASIGNQVYISSAITEV
ncbi:hypothetical protein [Clostridium sp.]|uniref:hypothetical protein n=1 Tax=Clostridium sp. TaxID=1506 RepID=UPI00283E9286|nr:hypothetical protein [Clostridium sp.]MDR3598122.1 hypothetical protein [Clostridium sp.]